MQYVTPAQLVGALRPIVMALHEKGLLDIAEIPHFYEDDAERMRLQGRPESELEIQKGCAIGFARMAAQMKEEEKKRPKP